LHCIDNGRIDLRRPPHLNQHRTLSHAISAYDAVSSAPSLAHLARLGRESNARLMAIRPLIPEALRSAVQAGPLDDKSWCLLINSNAAAAKIRQLLPSIQSRLQSEGLMVKSIRLKILVAKRS
jgi:hypothetical protein